MIKDSMDTLIAVAIIALWFLCLFGGLWLTGIDKCLPIQIIGGVLAVGSLASLVWFLDKAGS